MKQGSGKSSMAGTKTDPVSRSVSLDRVANLGQQIVRTHPPSKELYNGRGYTAPKPVTTASHKCGSQGKH